MALDDPAFGGWKNSDYHILLIEVTDLEHQHRKLHYSCLTFRENCSCYSNPDSAVTPKKMENFPFRHTGDGWIFKEPLELLKNTQYCKEKTPTQKIQKTPPDIDSETNNNSNMWISFCGVIERCLQNNKIWNWFVENHWVFPRRLSYVWEWNKLL